MNDQSETMEFEVYEAERVFDFVNLSFGAFLSAYLGVMLARDPASFEIWRLVGLLIFISFVGLSLRGLGIAAIRGISTTRHSMVSIFSLVAGSVGYVIACRDLGFSFSIMGVIGIGWLVAPLIGLIPLILRRWVKLYD